MDARRPAGPLNPWRPLVPAVTVLDRCGTDQARTEAHDVELRWCHGQGRHPTADIAVFSRVQRIQISPTPFVWAAFTLVSRGMGGVVVHGDTGSCGLVQISWAVRRQNRARGRLGLGIEPR